MVRSGRSRPPGTRHFERAVTNLRWALEGMVRQAITGSAAVWAETLADLIRRSERAQVPLALAGSAALAVRGVIEVSRQRLDRVAAVDDFCAHPPPSR